MYVFVNLKGVLIVKPLTVKLSGELSTFLLEFIGDSPVVCLAAGESDKEDFGDGVES